MPSRSARFITSLSSISRGRQAEKAQKYPLRLHPHTMSQQSTSCWIRRCNRQYIFPRSSLSSAADRRELSLSTASAAAGPESRGADDRERSFFPQKKCSQWTHSIPSRTERACSSPKHITHRSRVWSSVRQRWHGSTHLLKRFSTDISTHTSETRSPEGKKRGCVPQVPFYARRCSLACVIGVHLPMSSALGVFNHASGNRSRWRRSHSVP